MNEGPIRHFTLLVLLQAQQDHATELTVGLGSAGRSPIRYKVEGAWYEMSPPPPALMPGVIADLGRMAALSDSPFPKEGLVDMAFGGVRLRWVVRALSPDADFVLTPVGL